MDLNSYFENIPIFSDDEKTKYSKEIQSIDDLLIDLKNYPSSQFVFNQFKNKTQFKNLKNYLYYHLKYESKMVVIGEASGYNGCKYSGIPFTSGFIMAHNPIFMKIKPNFDLELIAHISEKSANCFYEFFNSHEGSWNNIVMWNAFPFHPHNIKVDESNRTPSKNELEIGIEYFKKLNSIFKFKVICAIGKKAQFSLQRIGIKEIDENILFIDIIRHPSYGGKKEFLEQMEKQYNISKILIVESEK